MDTFALLVQIELLLCTFGMAETNDFVKSEIRLSKYEASRKCSVDGSRLVDHSEIQTSEPQILPLLSNGESVWIDGYTKFSPFLAEHGCFKTPKHRLDLTSYRLKTANLYFCITKCLRDKRNVSYIGIENKYCVCFDDEDRKSVNNDIVDSSLCNFRCSNFAIGFCGGSKYINIYRIVDESQIVWADHQPSLGQCVYVQLRNENNVQRFSASSSSCFFSHGVNGYICTNSRFSALNTDKCYNHIRNYCLVRKLSTRQEAFTDCLNKNGSLTEYFGERFSVELMTYGQRYWISVFRTFQPTQMASKGITCLAVRKVSGKIYLEPDSCMAKKRYLCRLVNKTTSWVHVSGTESAKTILPPTLKPIEESTTSDQMRIFSKNTILNRDNFTYVSRTKAAVSPVTHLNVKTSKKPTRSGGVPDKDDSTTELDETTPGSAKYWGVSGKDYNSKINRPKTTLSPVKPISLQTMTARPKTYKIYSISTDSKRITLSSGRNIFNHLSTVSVNANINASDQNKNEISVIVYILPSSLLLLGVIPVIIGFVIYIRKIKQQNKFKRRSQSNPSYSYVRSSDIDQNISTQYTESFPSNVYQNAERTLNPKDKNFKTQNLHEDQYDKIEFVETQPKTCVDTNQYDHPLHGTENTYNNIEDARPTFICAIAKNITPFTSCYRTENGMRSGVKRDSKIPVSHYTGTAYCKSVQTEEQHIYDKPFEENHV